MVLLYLVFRGIKEPAYRLRRSERLGKLPADIGSGYIWFHAVSTGEALAALPIIEDVLTNAPARKVLVTTTTPTGSEVVQTKLGSRVAHCYAPYDIPICVKSFLTRIRPQFLFLIETELWPNLIHYTHKHGTPIYLINARLSERSQKGYRRLRDLTGSMLSKVHGVACQYDDSLRRFKELGVEKERLFLTGNAKFDSVPVDSMSNAQKSVLKQFVQSNSSVWIAGSTHPSEEPVVLAAHCKLLQAYGNTKLILVPRHMVRCREVIKLCNRLNLQVSTLSSPKAASDVLVLDQMGLLFQAYRYAHVAYVGGSLHGVGGHNPIEPAYYGIPILMGPYRYNFAEICRRFEERNCLLKVSDANDLAKLVSNLFADDHFYQQISNDVERVLENNRGARARISAMIEQWLSKVEDITN
ncbi:MAG: 3-deoxy-D-manno-octulosonic acid transferase [Gammaproteobacteria bacterium]|nr:3-deoxy-D-manno-octulosonic acid transferase [Gammaproteobacteria bacterium]MDE0252020.1 3-deoxy-D-manno-octulosonic acid transferase [Gammaproteobacteria bacterium]MDE0402872.1 3-deoxy-D-manno-octulosonic acid transferase [Gammaproteobacteria bacterium]